MAKNPFARKIRMMADQAYGFEADIKDVLNTFENMPDDAHADLDDIVYNIASFKEDIEALQREIEDEL